MHLLIKHLIKPFIYLKQVDDKHIMERNEVAKEQQVFECPKVHNQSIKLTKVI